MGIDEVFNVGGRSFIQIRKSKGLKIDPWGTPGYVNRKVLQYCEDGSQTLTC
jgi:hypothetical protein